MVSRLYSEGSRRSQDQFDTRRIADRLEKLDLLEEFTDEHRAIEVGGDEILAIRPPNRASAMKVLENTE